MDASITIKLKINDFEIELSPADARKLLETLKTVLGESTYIPYYPITAPNILCTTYIKLKTNDALPCP